MSRERRRIRRKGGGGGGGERCFQRRKSKHTSFLNLCVTQIEIIHACNLTDAVQYLSLLLELLERGEPTRRGTALVLELLKVMRRRTGGKGGKTFTDLKMNSILLQLS